VRQSDALKWLTQLAGDRGLLEAASVRAQTTFQETTMSYDRYIVVYYMTTEIQKLSHPQISSCEISRFRVLIFLKHFTNFY
jgi:hypothetical protein